MSELVSRIKNLIIEKLDVPESGLTNEASFVKDLGVDSLDLLELLMEVEKEFEINIKDEEMESITTVGALIEYISNHSK